MVFEQAGWIGRDAILMTGINGLFYIASTIPPWYLVDIWGRRFILMSGAIVMAFFLMLIGYWMYLDTTFTPTAVVVCVVAYNAAFGFSWGPIPWLYVRRSGSMLLVVIADRLTASAAGNHAFGSARQRRLPFYSNKLGFQLGSGRIDADFADPD